MKLRHRHRLRKKEIVQLSAGIESTCGVSPFTGEEPLDRAQAPQYDVLILKNRVVALVFDGVPILSVRGILDYGATKSHVTVDMGAVPYVTNGADVMAPGIVEADASLNEGDYAWVRDERNGKPLAIVRMLRSGVDIMENRSGKAAKNIHYVGDKLWELLC